MFANEYFDNWVVAPKETITPAFTNYDNARRTFTRSAQYPTAPTLTDGSQYYRGTTVLEDPLISMGGWNLAPELKKTIYAGKSHGSHRYAPYEEFYVFIRESPPTEFDVCLSPSGYLCAASRTLVENE